jgi:hypothetical protein
MRGIMGYFLALARQRELEPNNEEVEMATWITFKSNNGVAAGKLRRALSRSKAMQVVRTRANGTMARFSSSHAVGPWLDKLASDCNARVTSRNALAPNPDHLGQAACGAWMANPNLSRVVAAHETHCNRCKALGAPLAKGASSPLPVGAEDAQKQLHARLRATWIEARELAEMSEKALDAIGRVVQMEQTLADLQQRWEQTANQRLAIIGALQGKDNSTEK